MHKDKKKYQVFISSVISFLEEERLEAINTILILDCIPICMEVIPSMPIESWEAISKLIEESDYMITIVGGQCGSLTDNDTKSWTEKEYDFAIEKGIPTVCFIKKDEAINKPEIETEKLKKEILEKFINKLSKTFRTKWSDKQELCKQISQSLTKMFKDNPRPGWIKADSGTFNPSNNEKDSEEIKNLFEILNHKKTNILLEIKNKVGKEIITSESSQSFSYIELLEIINDLCNKNHRELRDRLEFAIEEKINLSKKESHVSYSIKDDLKKIVNKIITYFRSQDVLLEEDKDEDRVEDINRFYGKPNFQKIQGVVTVYSITQKGCKLLTFMNE